MRTSSFSIYVNTKEALHRRGYLADSSKLWHTALSGAAGGATSGVIIRFVWFLSSCFFLTLTSCTNSCGSAPFELVKVQRQLEYLTAVQKGLVTQVGSKYQARSGFQAAAEIWRYHGGPKGFYLGFPLREYYSKCSRICRVAHQRFHPTQTCVEIRLAQPSTLASTIPFVPTSGVMHRQTQNQEAKHSCSACQGLSSRSCLALLRELHPG